MSKKTHTKITAVKPNHKELTPAEWSACLKEALQLYKDAVWNLAEILALGKNKFGRNTLWKMTPLPHNKVGWLVAITTVNRRYELLPEHHYEVVGNKDADKLLQQAIDNNLNPIELRKQVRATHRKVVTEDKANISTWSKSFSILEREINKLDSTTRDRIMNHIKGKLR